MRRTWRFVPLFGARFASLFAALLLFAMLTACEEDADVRVDAKDYDEAALIEAREEKDKAFRTSSDSPIPPAQRESFGGLRFYDPSADYYLIAAVTWHNPPDTIVIGTTMGGEQRKAIRAATLSFKLNGQTSKLTGFRFIDTPTPYEGMLFVPFRDATNGFATYEAGRYMDVPLEQGDDSVAVDFNTAYHPLCLFNYAYSCPLPPTENTLPYKVEAGERK